MALEVHHLVRLSLVHVVYIGYPAYTWYLCIINADSTGYDSTSVKIACAVWFFIHVSTQVVLFKFGVKEKPIMTKSWFLVYMFCFTLFTMPPYMFTLKMLYDIADTRLNQKVGQSANITNLIHISINDGDYVVFQVAMVILLLTYIVYPLPRRPYDIGAYLALAIEFMNAFDIMDMVGDIAFIRGYELGWRSVYYMSLGISVLLLSFPVNIEEDVVDFPNYFFGIVARLMSRKERHNSNTVNDGRINAGFHAQAEIECVCVVKEGQLNEADVAAARSGSQKSETSSLETQEQENKGKMKDKSSAHGKEAIGAACGSSRLVSKLQGKVSRQEHIRDAWKRVLKAAATIIFTDVMFAAIRIAIMIREHSVDHGFNMVVKNLILALLHSLYLVKHAKTLKMLYAS